MSVDAPIALLSNKGNFEKIRGSGELMCDHTIVTITRITSNNVDDLKVFGEFLRKVDAEDTSGVTWEVTINPWG